MIAGFVFILAALGQSPETRIPALLESDPELLAQHRTYMALVQSPVGGKGLAVSERGYVALLSSPEFENLTKAMNAVLEKHPQMAKAVERFNETLEQHPEIENSLDTLKKWRQTHPGEQADLSSIINDLASQNKSLPGAQGPAAAMLEKHPELRSLLTNLSSGLGEDAQARQGLQGWWETMGALRGGGMGAQTPGELLAQPNAALAKLLMEQAGKVAQAMEPETQWLQDWHDRIRKDPELGVAYWQYVDYALHHPQAARTTELGWKTQFGASPQWPPSDLSASQSEDTSEASKSASDKSKSASRRQRPDKPKWPSIQRPTAPTRPKRPTAE